VTTAATTSCATIPEETGGPFPGDGSNGKNILTQAGVVRQDIRSSIGSASATAKGVPLTIEFTILDNAKGCAPIPGAAVYVWHCDRDGQYSMYSQGVTNENYLRGVQAADSNGKVSFTSIFPGDYAGRWPHVHFEVYPDVATALTGKGILATSQIALPKDACQTVYATDGYAQSTKNLAGISLATDNVFADDGGVHQLATMSGTVSAGLTAALSVAV
jgi:protocatechuate 3,4-dioxygenase beta subunit